VTLAKEWALLLVTAWVHELVPDLVEESVHTLEQGMGYELDMR
jgi:hypothetical protein